MGMTGQASLCPVLSSRYLAVTGHALLLFGYGISGIAEDLFNPRQRDFLRVVVDMNRLGRDIHVDRTHAVQFANSSFNRVLAMLTRNVGGYQCRRFHDRYPPLIHLNHFESKRYNSSPQRCSCSELHSKRMSSSIALHFSAPVATVGGSMEGSFLWVSSNRVELDQLLDDLLFAVTFDPLRNTGTQVPLQDNGFQFLQCFAYRIGLSQDVHTVLVFLHHLAYS